MEGRVGGKGRAVRVLGGSNLDLPSAAVPSGSRVGWTCLLMKRIHRALPYTRIGGDAPAHLERRLARGLSYPHSNTMGRAYINQRCTHAPPSATSDLVAVPCRPLHVWVATLETRIRLRNYVRALHARYTHVAGALPGGIASIKNPSPRGLRALLLIRRLEAREGVI